MGRAAWRHPTKQSTQATAVMIAATLPNPPATRTSVRITARCEVCHGALLTQSKQALELPQALRLPPALGLPSAPQLGCHGRQQCQYFTALAT